jgi:predicted nucleic acid-binding protein
MTALLDTSVLIDLLRGHAPAHRFAGALDDVPICSEVTRVEIVRGLRSSERGAADRLLRSLRWAGVDEPVARRAGELGRAWRRSHQGLSIADLIIAATAEELDAQLATCNVRHFPMFTGLRPPYAS